VNLRLHKAVLGQEKDHRGEVWRQSRGDLWLNRRHTGYPLILSHWGYLRDTSWNIQMASFTDLGCCPPAILLVRNIEPSICCISRSSSHVPILLSHIWYSLCHQLEQENLVKLNFKINLSLLKTTRRQRELGN